MCSSTNCRKHTRIDYTDDKIPYCPEHLNNPELREYEHTKLVRRKSGNFILCDAVACDSIYVTFHRRGYFCEKHIHELDQIRESIDHTGSEEEIIARKNEIHFRKRIHFPHLMYFLSLYNRSSDSSCKL